MKIKKYIIKSWTTCQSGWLILAFIFALLICIYPEKIYTDMWQPTVDLLFLSVVAVIIFLSLSVLASFLKSTQENLLE